jgi:hypothetical protein
MYLGCSIIEEEDDNNNTNNNNYYLWIGPGFIFETGI